MNKSLEDRFWKKVNPVPTETGCWIWVGATNKKGYGEFWNSLRDGKHTRAHQVSWILEHGDIPDGMDVCHTCDNPPCVNPRHLFLGTTQDNVDDMMNKGRHRVGKIYCGNEHPQHGTNSKHHKLSEQDVLEVRKLYSEGHTLRSIASKFGVVHGVINNIIQGRKWAWLK